MSRQPTEITIYWDSQDPWNEGWAFRLCDESGDIGSGPIDCGGPDDDLDDVIDGAMHELDIDLTHDDFARDPTEDGGWAIWRQHRYR